MRNMSFILMYLISLESSSLRDKQKTECRMNIYIGNLSFDTAEENLRQAFQGYGEVSKVNIIADRYTGKSRGFGFVEMPTKGEAQAAITGLNGQEMDGQTLNVNEARPRTERSGGGRGERHYNSW
jgi:RNA recognition motif-containing protein